VTSWPVGWCGYLGFIFDHLFIDFLSCLVFHFGLYIMSDDYLSRVSVSLASRLFCLYLGKIYHSCYYFVGSECSDSKAEYLILFVKFSEIVAIEGVQLEHCSKIRWVKGQNLNVDDICTIGGGSKISFSRY